MTMNHDRKETVRTIAAVISDLCGVVSVILQGVALWYIVHFHPH